MQGSGPTAALRLSYHKKRLQKRGAATAFVQLPSPFFVDFAPVSTR
ncbi:hypothetical protein HMPREF0262_03395 [Clostridium sp. ATCC 29733]|nr:hypothetical protein HMPREF0262_03395 [Clostridium sp. ATCC 29733]